MTCLKKFEKRHIFWGEGMTTKTNGLGISGTTHLWPFSLLSPIPLKTLAGLEAEKSA